MRGIGVPIVRDTYGTVSCRTTMATQDGAWEEAMADVMAHLLSASSLLEELVWQHPQPILMMRPHDVASESVCKALVALDECSSLAWFEPEKLEAGITTSSTVSDRQDRLPQTLGCEAPSYSRNGVPAS
jgi:hypothetical protein